jgi:hypothetical protein
MGPDQRKRWSSWRSMRHLPSREPIPCWEALCLPVVYRSLPTALTRAVARPLGIPIRATRLHIGSERIPGREQGSHLRTATTARLPRSLAGCGSRGPAIGRGRDGERRSVNRTGNRPTGRRRSPAGASLVKLELTRGASSQGSSRPGSQCVVPWAPAGLCTWASPARRCARPGSGRRGSAAVQSRPARQGHTEACRRQDVGHVRQRRPCRRRWPPRRIGGMPARVQWRGRARRTRWPSGPTKACTVSRSGPPRPLYGGERVGAMASYDARGS